MYPQPFGPCCDMIKILEDQKIFKVTPWEVDLKYKFLWIV